MELYLVFGGLNFDNPLKNLFIISFIPTSEPKIREIAERIPLMDP